MFRFLQNHPFAVVAHFETSLVLTYAVPAAQLQKLIPPCLQLDTFNNEWGFVAVAIVKTKALRPKGFPAFAGNDFILTGYRVFVRYTTSKGKRLRGLYILKSETNKKKMEILGSLFTHYQYSTTDIQLKKEAQSIAVNSTKSALHISASISVDATLPSTSPFKTWQEARRFAGPLPFTFSYLPATEQVLMIEGVREDWKPCPVNILHPSVGFLNHPGLNKAVLASAFVVENIPYEWRKGKLDLWKR